MSTTTALAPPAPAPADEPYGRWRLTFGIVGRTWLWFMAGCLLVTLIPILFGWRPFLIESGSMQPRIKVGDVVLSAPTDATDADLVGHVVVFDDPDFPDRVKTHRAVATAEGGGLVTKGDANPTNDSLAVPRDNVIGLGRLLVRFVGLPVIWLHQGQWLYLALFLMSVLLAVLVVNRDREEDPDPSTGPDDDGDVGPSDRGSPPTPLPSRLRADTPTTIAATKQYPLSRAQVKTLGFRLVGVLGLCLMLLAPTTVAAFASSTKNTASSWTVPNASYTTEVTNLGPYLYWKLDETGTTATAADTSGNGRTGTYNASGATTYFTRLTDGALVSDTPDRAVTLTNAASCINTTSTTAITGPQTFTLIAWFRAPATYVSGGKLIGFETPRTGVAAPTAGTYDRHLYMDGAGIVHFGVYNGGDVVLDSPSALNNNAWHMAVATQGTGGTRLYIDGVQVDTSTNTAAEATTGWWRVGCGNLAGWGAEWTGGNSPGTASTTAANRPFLASMDEITVYSGTALTAAQVSLLYWAR